MRLSLTALSLPLFAAPRRALRCTLPAMIALWRSRRALAALSDAQLCDVGITRTEAFAEAGRPLWDASRPQSINRA